VFNARPFLEETIESVLAQSYRNWQLLLVDDGSTDGSAEIAERCAEQHRDRIRYAEHEGHANRGAAASRNHGIEISDGEHVAFLDADDVWLPNKLEEQVAILTARPEVGMVFGSSSYWRTWSPDPAARLNDFVPDPKIATETVHTPPSLLLQLYPLGAAPTPCPSDVIVRRRTLERTGGFEPEFHGIYQLYEDQAFLAKIFLEEPVYVSSACWDRYRVHPESCVTRVNDQGHYHTVRRYYLDWFTRYLERKGVDDRALWSALRRARRVYEPTLLDRLTRPLRRLRGAQ
jgi:glycosyltransferase involved in cell wall biosynthesis